MLERKIPGKSRNEETNWNVGKSLERKKVGLGNRVTRLGEFSHWVFVFFGQNFEIYIISPNI
jgi:hypothetical protein